MHTSIYFVILILYFCEFWTFVTYDPDRRSLNLLFTVHILLNNTNTEEPIQPYSFSFEIVQTLSCLHKARTSEPFPAWYSLCYLANVYITIDPWGISAEVGDRLHVIVRQRNHRIGVAVVEIQFQQQHEADDTQGGGNSPLPDSLKKWKPCNDSQNRARTATW